MIFFTLVCLGIAWLIVRWLFCSIWRIGAEITASKSENRFLEISHRLGRMWSLPRWMWRNDMPVFGLKFLNLVVLTLIAIPNPSLLACACTDVVVSGSSGTSTSIVDEYDGRFAINQVDVDISGITPIQIVRNYNSLNATYGIFGFGWTVDGVFCHLENTSGDIEINFGDHEEYFHSADSYRNADNSLWLTFTGTNEVKVENKSGEKWYFSTIDKTLTKKVDKNGNQTQFVWNIVQKQIGVDVDNNPVYQDIYCPETITYPDGRALNFTYSLIAGEEYLCTQVVSPDGTTTNYSYTQGLLTGISKPTGQTLSYNYHTDTNSYRTIGWLTNITYANAGQVNITYNGEFNTGNALRVVTITGPEGYERNFAYTVEDGKDLNCNKCITTKVTDSLGHITTYAKSDTGKTKRITDALGYYKQDSRDDSYRLISSINRNGYWTTYGYANANNSNAPVLTRNLRTHMTNALGNVTIYGYDADGNQTSVTDPLGHQISYTFDSNRNLTSQKNGLGQIIATNRYDAYGQVVSTKNGAGEEVVISYNSQGYQTNIIDPAGKSWSKTYDNSGRIISTKDPLGHQTTAGYNVYGKISALTNALGLVTTLAYDEMANQTQIVDANGNATKYGYDKLQRSIVITNALNNITQFSFNSESKVTLLRDGMGREYSFSYDSVNKPKTLTFPGGLQEVYAYDPNGNKTNFLNTANQTITYAYDALDRKIGKNWVGTTNTVFIYNYDNANRLIETRKMYASSTLSSASYSYNDANQVTNIIQNGKVLGCEYDSAQRLSKIVYPSTLQARYQYNSRGLIDSLKDAGGNVIAGYIYDDAGRLLKRTLPNGLETIYTYDAANQVTNISLRQISNTNNILQSFQYGYDNVGNRLWAQYADGTGDVYRYDSTYQLIGVKYGVSNPTSGYDNAINATRTVSYTYDAVGNRSSVTDNGNSNSYTKNNLNEYTAIGGVNYTFSARGDLVSDGTWTFGYDFEGNLSSASKSGLVITYTYDADGYRIYKCVNGITTKYVYSSGNIIEERNASDVVTAQYIYELGLDRPVAVIKGGNAYYFQRDALGSVTALTNASGAIVERYSYDVFGKPKITDGSGSLLSSSLTPYLFTGREYEWETGLYHYRARAYSPELGRFLQIDPLRFKAGDVNLYRYVGNNPVNSIDPNGTFEWYGNWGGPGYTGGWKGKTWNQIKDRPPQSILPPIDSQDACYEAHDKCYGDCENKCTSWEKFTCRLDCDSILSDCLANVIDNNQSGNNWQAWVGMAGFSLGMGAISSIF